MLVTIWLSALETVLLQHVQRDHIKYVGNLTFISRVFFKNLETKGFLPKGAHNKLVQTMDRDCSLIGSSYQEATVKYCNCDGCNGDVLKCEISSPE
jgi:hypothetical protein